MSEQEEQPKNAAADTSGNRGQGNDLGSSSAIGRRLKAYYDDVASEPVPDKFLSLLEALDAASEKSGGSDHR